MAASRSVHKGVYTSDILAQDFRRRVDDHFFTQTPLNWTNATTQLPLPGTVRCRHAVGVDSSGRRHSVVVPNTTATLWTAPNTNTWSILDDTGALDTVTVTGLVGEAVTF
jgi:hypothetical protein